MVLSRRQEEILIGIILGDGCLEKNGNHVRVRIEHGEGQKDYLNWKYSELQNLATDRPRLVQSYHDKAEKFYRRWHFSTYSLPVLDKYRNIFYKQGRKIIPASIKKCLQSPLSLAVWFMDDGYKRSDCNALRISTDSFTMMEQKHLQQSLQENFGIRSKLHKKGEAWNVYIPQVAAGEFCRIIRPYIISSLTYKIALTP